MVIEVQEAGPERPFKDLQAKVIVDSAGNRYLIHEAEMKVERGDGLAERQSEMLSAIRPGDVLRITRHPWSQPTGFTCEVEVLPIIEKKK